MLALNLKKNVNRFKYFQQANDSIDKMDNIDKVDEKKKLSA